MVVMKHFKHILMGPEIFFKFFDGHKIFSYDSIFVILLFILRGLEHKISKLAIKEIKEIQGMLNKSHPISRHKASSGIIKKNV